MNVNAFLQKDYENEPPSGSKKTKPKQTQFPKGQNEQKKPEKPANFSPNFYNFSDEFY
ncbi:MAG TPA: hypothetical protein VMW72_23640 [Sedimentisphaerales bacterium]|nr:hypothetical protein [Sedimentisphaerales bacterium]